MTRIGSILGIGLVSFTLAVMPTPTFAESQTALAVPRSVQLQHEQIVRRLESIAQRGGPTSASASKAAEFLKGHYAKEEEFALPPLGLLSTLLNSPNPADLQRAVVMAERTKAALPELMLEHVQINAMMSDLIEAATQNKDDELVRLATRVAAQSLNDVEVLYPTTILIGEHIRSKLLKGN